MLLLVFIVYFCDRYQLVDRFSVSLKSVFEMFEWYRYNKTYNTSMVSMTNTTDQVDFMARDDLFF